MQKPRRPIQVPGGASWRSPALERCRAGAREALRDDASLGAGEGELAARLGRLPSPPGPVVFKKWDRLDAGPAAVGSFFGGLPEFCEARP